MGGLQKCVNIDDLDITSATPADSLSLSKLYASVYHGEYPSPELFTEKGMATFLDFDRSHAYTFKVVYGEEVISIGTFQLHGRAAYSRGFMVAPQWQGRVGAKQIIQRMCREFANNLQGEIDYFYAEMRTELAKIQTIVEEIGWKSYALLPRKDIFHQKRESEVIYAWFYNLPEIRPFMLTRLAAQVTSAVLNRAISYFEPPENIAEFRTNMSKPNSKYEVFSKGEGKITLHLRKGKLTALVCPTSRNAEHVQIYAKDAPAYYTLVTTFLRELHKHAVEYAEIYAPTYNLVKQVILESQGFLPTGFVPRWYAPGSNTPGDYIVYTISFPSTLQDCPLSLTEQGEYLRAFLSQSQRPKKLMNRELTQVLNKLF